MIFKSFKSIAEYILVGYRKNTAAKAALTVAHLLLFWLLFISRETANTDIIILLFLTLAGSQTVILHYQSPLLRAYFKKPGIAVLLFAVILYISFAARGNYLFLHPVNFANQYSWLQFFLFAVWVSPVVMALLYVFEYLQRIIQTRKYTGLSLPQKTKSYYFWFLLSLLLAILYWIAFNPAILSYDSFQQWHQATGEYELTNWHPAFHTLLIKLLINIYPSPGTIAIAQIFFFSAVFASLLTFLNKQGISKYVIIAFCGIMILTPTIGLMLVNIWKDTPYSTAVLWLSLLLAKIITYPKDYTNKASFIIQLTLALVLVFFFRQNGILVYAFTSISLLVIFLRRKTPGALWAIFASLALIWAIHGPLYNKFDVQPAPAGNKYLAMMHDIAGVYFSGGKVTETTEAFLNKISNLDHYEELYYAYSVKTAHLKPEFHNIRFQEIAGVYLQTFRDNPALMLNNILLRTDIYWGIPTGKDGFIVGINYRGIDIKPHYTLQPQRWNNILSRVFHRVCDFTTTRIAFINIFWRYGLWMALFMVCVVFIIKNNKHALLWVALPFLTNILSLVVSSGWLDHRYGFSTVLVIPFILLYSLYFRTTNKSDDRKTV